jgi:pimeloyl-ACP methyl ester carboxylesterase
VKLESSADCGSVVREIVRIRAADGCTIWATVHRPRGAAKGAAVLVPGWSGPRSGPAEVLKEMADSLAGESSFLCVRFDIRGRGDSEGEFGETDLDMMIEDALSACRFAMDASGAEKVAAIGLCSGGNVALGAATLEERISKVAALSTYPFQPSRSKELDAARRRRNIAAYARKLFCPDSWRKLFRGEIDFRRVRKNIEASDRNEAGGRNLKDSRRDIERELQNYRGRCLFVYGGADEEGLMALSYFQAFASSHSIRAGFHVVEGANHNFYRKAWKGELTAIVRRFMESDGD